MNLLDKNLILHIGAPKTASTYLQNLFYWNFYINKASPIEYPLTRKQSLLHSNAVVNSGNIQPMLWKQQILCFSSVSDSPNILFSSENLHRFIHGSLDSFFELKNKFRSVKCFAYVRSPIFYLLSGYAQALKTQPHIKTIDDYIPYAVRTYAIFAELLKFIDIDIIFYDDFKDCIEKPLSCLFAPYGVAQIMPVVSNSSNKVNPSLCLHQVLMIESIKQKTCISTYKLQSMIKEIASASYATPLSVQHYPLTRSQYNRYIENISSSLYDLSSHSLFRGLGSNLFPIVDYRSFSMANEPVSDLSKIGPSYRTNSAYQSSSEIFSFSSFRAAFATKYTLLYNIIKRICMLLSLFKCRVLVRMP